MIFILFSKGNFMHNRLMRNIQEQNCTHYPKASIEQIIYSMERRPALFFFNDSHIKLKFLEFFWLKYAKWTFCKRSILHYCICFTLYLLKRESTLIIYMHLEKNNISKIIFIITVIIIIFIAIIINNFIINKTYKFFFSLVYTYILLNKPVGTLFYQFLILNQYLLQEYKCNDFFL